MSLLNRIIILLRGKNVAVLGPRVAGKSTLYSLLTTGEASADAEQTIGPTRVRGARNKNLGLTISKGVDLPGHDRAYPDWEKQFVKASLVFYVFDAHKARTQPDYASRIEQDGRKMKEWGLSAKRKIVLLGTHADKDPLFEALTPAEYSDLILDLDVIAALHGRVRVAACEVGSIRATREGTALLGRLLQALAS